MHRRIVPPVCSAAVHHPASVKSPAARLLAGRRGLTLIEMLIAMTILLAIIGLVAPTFLESLDRRRFESTEQHIINHLILARAHAQTTGQTVEVRYNPDRQTLTASMFDLPDGNGPNGYGRDNFVNGGNGLTFGDTIDRRDDDGAEIPHPWSRRRLSDGVRLTREQPEVNTGRNGAFNEPMGEAFEVPDDPFEDAFDAMLGGEDDAYRIAVFVPDGSAMLTRPLWLVDESQRVSRIEINAWNGIARLRRLDRPDAESRDDREYQFTEQPAEMPANGRGEPAKPRGGTPGGRR